ncbi:MAG: hypothetical protein RLZZ453_657 [Chlamydiota bacterium]|jgi:membrane protein YqaA with SNARE-associated domain
MFFERVDIYKPIGSADNFLTEIEREFNIAGAIPLLSIYSGAIRCLLGACQATGGGIIGTIGVVGSIFSDDPKYRKQRQMGGRDIVHGMLNQVRGSIEGILGASVLGTVCNLGFHIYADDKFQPWIKYNQKTGFEELCSRTEYVFNKAATIPLVGALFALIRSFAGFMQFLNSFLIGTVGLIGSCFSSREVFKENCEIGRVHMLHGIANMVRGLIEIVASLSIIGGIVSYIVQMHSKNSFNPLLGYPISTEGAPSL